MASIYRYRIASGAFEYAVYVGNKLIRTCPSEGMAREVAAAAA
jgi:hypothetical protein